MNHTFYHDSTTPDEQQPCDYDSTTPEEQPPQANTNTRFRRDEPPLEQPHLWSFTSSSAPPEAPPQDQEQEAPPPLAVQPRLQERTPSFILDKLYDEKEQQQQREAQEHALDQEPDQEPYFDHSRRTTMALEAAAATAISQFQLSQQQQKQQQQQQQQQADQEQIQQKQEVATRSTVFSSATQERQQQRSRADEDARTTTTTHSFTAAAAEAAAATAPYSGPSNPPPTTATMTTTTMTHHPSTMMVALQDDRPKRPLSAYNLFFRDERQRILASHPVRPEGVPRRSHGKMGFAEMARTVSQAWKVLNVATKQEYEVQGRYNRLCYKRHLAAWKYYCSNNNNPNHNTQNVNGSTTYNSNKGKGNSKKQKKAKGTRKEKGGGQGKNSRRDRCNNQDKEQDDDDDHNNNNNTMAHPTATADGNVITPTPLEIPLFMAAAAAATATTTAHCPHQSLTAAIATGQIQILQQTSDSAAFVPTQQHGTRPPRPHDGPNNNNNPRTNTITNTEKEPRQTLVQQQQQQQQLLWTLLMNHHAQQQQQQQQQQDINEPTANSILNPQLHSKPQRRNLLLPSSRITTAVAPHNNSATKNTDASSQYAHQFMPLQHQPQHSLMQQQQQYHQLPQQQSYQSQFPLFAEATMAPGSDLLLLEGCTSTCNSAEIPTAPEQLHEQDQQQEQHHPQPKSQHHQQCTQQQTDSQDHHIFVPAAVVTEVAQTVTTTTTPIDFFTTSKCNNKNSSRGADRQSSLVSRTPSPSFLLGPPTAHNVGNNSTEEVPTLTMMMLIEQAKLIGEINHLVNDMGGGHHPATAEAPTGGAVVEPLLPNLTNEQQLQQSGVVDNNCNPGAASWASALSALTPTPFPWAGGTMGATMAAITSVIGNELPLHQHVREQRPQELQQQQPPIRCFGDPQYFPPYHHPMSPAGANEPTIESPTNNTMAHRDHRLVSNDDNNGNDDDNNDNDDSLSGLFRVFGPDIEK